MTLSGAALKLDINRPGRRQVLSIRDGRSVASCLYGPQRRAKHAGHWLEIEVIK
jgi:hypothetical protein